MGFAADWALVDAMGMLANGLSVVAFSGVEVGAAALL